LEKHQSDLRMMVG